MKRIGVILLCILLLCGCTTTSPTPVEQETPPDYFYGIWVTYAELNKMASSDFKAGFTALVNQSVNMGATALFVHTCAFCDSLFASKVYPQCAWSASLDYDVMSFMIDTCHQQNLAFHAWINPYRIDRSSQTVLPTVLAGQLSEADICRCEAGLYLNPASLKARSLITAGIRELLDTYPIDGIHFDDYFYPTAEPSFDAPSYKAYCETAAVPLSLDDFRRANVNVMIASVASLTRSRAEKTAFTVSPAADIEKNYASLYADVELWCQSGYLDAVIPQLYFGFEYPNERFCFENLLMQWVNLVSPTKTALYIGLAPYKLGTDATPDTTEWKQGVDVVANELKALYAQPFVSGAVFFSASSLFSDEPDRVQQCRLITDTIHLQKGE